MASVYRRSGSPFWWADFRDSDGQRCKRSTKCLKRSPALQIAFEWEKLAEKGRVGVLIEAQARKVVSDIVETATGKALQFHSCRAWLKEWLAGKRGAVRERSLQKYEQVVKDFCDHLGERADLTLAAISPTDIRSFRDALLKGGRTPGTVNQIVRKVLIAPFSAAQRLGLIPTNPCAAIEALQDTTDAERDTFSSEQIRALLSVSGVDWKGVILFGFYTGLRLRDVTELCWSSIDLEEGSIRIKTGKTGAVLVIPIHEELGAWLHEQPQGVGIDPIFKNLVGKKSGGHHGLSGRFTAIMKKAGVEGRLLRGEDGKGRRMSSLTFHSFRHSFVSALANAGVAPELRRKLSGHLDERSHNIYTHHEFTPLRAAIELLPRVGGSAS